MANCKSSFARPAPRFENEIADTRRTRNYHAQVMCDKVESISIFALWQAVLGMIPFRDGPAGNGAGQMTFPRNETSLRQHTVKNPAIEDQD